MINYQNGKIYKIINETNDIVYIGSTVNSLSRRYSSHKYKSPNNKIILIENYACNSKEELCRKEQEIIEEHNNLLNIKKAYRSEEELKYYTKKYNKKYFENNKEEKKKYDKEYYQQNIEKLKKKRNEKINCEFCNCLISKKNIKQHQKSIKCMKFQFIED